MAGQPQANMEEILSSIRTTLEEETARVVSGEPGEAADMTDEEILALSETDMLDEPVETPAGAGGEAGKPDVIDLEAFASSGSVTMTQPTAKDDVLGMNLGAEGESGTPEAVVPDDTAPVAVEEAPVVSDAPVEAETQPVESAAEGDDAFDKLLNEIKLEKEVSHEDRVESLLGEDKAEEPSISAEEEISAGDDVAVSDGVAEARTLELAAIPGATGLQVALPAEVLAEALRPLITQWLSQNLPIVVERMVREEIAKLTQQ